MEGKDGKSAAGGAAGGAAAGPNRQTMYKNKGKDQEVIDTRRKQLVDQKLFPCPKTEADNFADFYVAEKNQLCKG